MLTEAEIWNAARRLKNEATTKDVEPEILRCLLRNMDTRRMVMQLIEVVWKSGSYPGEHEHPESDDKEEAGLEVNWCKSCGGKGHGCVASRDDSDGFIYKEWNCSKLVPIPKKPPLSNPGNWRDIHILDAIGALVTGVLAKRMDQWAKGALQESQNGFRPKRGTQDSLWVTTEVLRQRRRAGVVTWVVFVDIKKAFPSLSRKAMFIILTKYGFPPHFVNLLRRFHDNAKMKFKIGKTTHCVRNRAGVRTGSKEGPTLFNVI